MHARMPALRRPCSVALALLAAGCAQVPPDSFSAVPDSPMPAGMVIARQQREAEMNRAWQNRPLTQLVRTLGDPRLSLDIPGGGNPPGFVVVYGRDRATGCLDAFAVNLGTDPTVRLYSCR